jgi:Transcriptional Coactivator p15 (PC4)
MSDIIAEIDRGRGEVLRIEVSEYKGKKNLNLRIWYTDKDGEKKPTQKGVTISPENYEQLKEAILEAGSRF